MDGKRCSLHGVSLDAVAGIGSASMHVCSKTEVVDQRRTGRTLAETWCAPSSSPAASQWRRVQERCEREAMGAKDGINNDSGDGCMQQNDKSEKRGM